jgi:SAM-dependent methyltransferase/uncharacterized protein YbaR (Trm112 family)
VRRDLVDLICCAGCFHAPLELEAVEGDDDRVETGYLFCRACGRFFFVLDGIPRLIGEELRQLVDLTLVHDRPDAFAARARELEVFLGRLERGAADTWSVEDATYWEGYFGAAEPETVAGTPDRLLLRERHLFSHLRGRLRGTTLIDMGCGRALYIAALCDPREVGYRYVGADLSVAGLRLARDAVAGDFVQCSIELPPFRDEVAGAVIALGSLHHLEAPVAAIERMLSTLEPGGILAIHEVIWRRSTPAGGNVHNESIELPAALEVIASAARVVDVKYEHSPVRALLSARLRGTMASRPWLTRLLLAADDAWLASVGRAGGFLGPRGAFIVAEKR